MATTLAPDPALRHRVLPETAASSLAKADLRKPETVTDPEWKRRIGEAVREVRGAKTLNEMSGLIGKEERQIARWERGEETPQLDRYFAHEAFRLPLVLALAKLGGRGVEVETVVRVRREVA